MSRPVVHTRKDCRLCGSVDLELALPMRASPIGDAYVNEAELSITQPSYPLSLYLCHQCGHLQAVDVVDPEILFGNYIYSTSTSPGLVEHFKQYAKEVVASAGCAQGSLVVEVGSNDGSLLRAFHDEGMRVLGVDPAREVAKQATAQGLETLSTFFTFDLAKTIKQTKGSAQIVAANNVFAHVDNMVDLLKGIHHLLDSEGIFVFEVSYLVDMVEKNVFDTIYHEHVCHHRIAPLEKFLNKYGMQLFDVKRISTKGGSVRAFAKLSSSKRVVKPIVLELMQLEERMKLDDIETYHTYSKKLDAIQSDLLDVLGEFKSQGKSIAGYGASPPVTTTIYQFELGSYIDFIADDNAIKQGRFSPGHHLPVLGSDALYAKKPACVVILAWQYADAIMKKHQKFLDEGGAFVVPLPHVQVYKASTL